MTPSTPRMIPRLVAVWLRLTAWIMADQVPS
jgi:hypothetical protein